MVLVFEFMIVAYFYCDDQLVEVYVGGGQVSLM